MGRGRGGGDEGAEADLASACEGGVVEGDVAEALGLREADEGAPYERDEDLGRDVGALGRVERARRHPDGGEDAALHVAALLVEVRDVVLHLQKLKRERLLPLKPDEPRPHLPKRALRPRPEIEPEEQRVAQRALRPPKHGVHEPLLALEMPVDRPHAHPRRLRDLRNRRSVKPPLRKHPKRRIEHAPPKLFRLPSSPLPAPSPLPRFIRRNVHSETDDTRPAPLVKPARRPDEPAPTTKPPSRAGSPRS